MARFSLIIPTRNRAAILERALQHLTSVLNGDPRVEIIVVDNDSTDRTRTMIENSFLHHSTGFRYVLERHPGLLAGRHAGWRAAEGEILVFLDDDVFVSESIIDAYQEVFEEPRVALAGGNNFPLFETRPPAWLEAIWSEAPDGRRVFPELSIIQMPHQEPVEYDPYLVWGCNFAVRRSTLEAARGFHPDGVPEALIRFRGDGETHIASYVRNNGLSTVFHPGASVQHWVSKGRMTIEYLKKRAFANGVSSSYTRLREKHFKARHPLVRGMRSITEPLRYPLQARLKSRQAPQVVNFCDAADEHLDIKELISTFTSKGREYHRRVFEMDKQVRDWVTKPDYIGNENPIVTLDSSRPGKSGRQ